MKGTMKIKAKKSYTYKEVCRIVHKAVVYGVKEHQKYIRAYNKYMLNRVKELHNKELRYRYD